MDNDCFCDARERIQQGMMEHGIPSLAVAVARGGDILWEEAFGWASREGRRPATIHTLYCLASVSKPVTATGVMKLVEEGKVLLDQPINRYLGRDNQLKVWIGEPDEVTVRRVANHTAGLPLHSNCYLPQDRCGRPPMEETIRRYGNIVTPPGERYRYSNLGYGVLGHLIEQVSGRSYSDFLRHEVFVPLGMTRAAGTLGPELAEFAATGYDEDDRPVPEWATDSHGASHVWCSVHDLLRFGLFHIKQRQPDQRAVLSEAMRDAMQVPTARMGNPNSGDLNLRPGSSYGVGWVIDDDALDYRVSHGGGMDGWATKLLMMPREGIVVAVVANRFRKFVYTVERDILCALLPEYAGRLAAFDAKRARSPIASSAPHSHPELTGEWSGIVHTYERGLPLKLSFKPSGDVHARLGDQLWTLVNDVEFANGCLTGRMAGNVFTLDTTRRPPHPFHHLALDLKRRGDRITGALFAVAGCEVNHWVELKREA